MFVRYLTQATQINCFYLYQIHLSLYRLLYPLRLYADIPLRDGGAAVL